MLKTQKKYSEQDMEKYLIGLDLGTSGCKCSLINTEGVVLNETYSAYSPVSRKPGYMEQPLADWVNAVFTCLKDITGTRNIPPAEIAALAVAGQMRGVVLLNKELTPLCDAILWNDIRCSAEVELIKKHYHQQILELTCNPINTMCTLPKLMWLKKHQSELWNRIYKILYPKDYINYILTDEIKTDHSDASGSSYYNLKNGNWEKAILDEYSIPENLLPEILDSFNVLGRLNRETAVITGLPEGLPVIAGCSDGTAEMLALGILDERECKIRLGTSAAVSSITNNYNNILNPKTYTWAYFQKGKWMIDLNTRSCAYSIEWLRKCCYSEYPEPVDAYIKMIEEASKVNAGAEDLLFYPYLLGEDAPYWDPGLRGSFTGLMGSHGRGHLARAVMEGVSFSIKDAATVIGPEFEKLESVKLTGGGVKNSLWVKILLSVLGKDGYICMSSGSSVGAAMLAGIGSGIFKDTDDAAGKCSSEIKKLEHIGRDTKIYQDKYFRYKENLGL